MDLLVARLAAYLRLLARCVWVQILAKTGCLKRAEKRLHTDGAIVTLTFHRVLNDAAYKNTNSLPGIVIRESTFQELVRYIRDCYETVAFEEADPGAPSRSLRMVLTFDDGWRDNYKIAFPIVSALRLPITIFVCPGAAGKAMPFWPERVIGALRATRPNTSSNEIARIVEALKDASSDQCEQYLAKLGEQDHGQPPTGDCSHVDTTLSWTEIVKMDKAGVCFGSHTDTHQILTMIPVSVAREELKQSKTRLEQMLGKPCQAFAYPNGNWSPEIRLAVKEAGFTRAVTTERGAWTAASDPLTIPRSNVCESNVVGITGRFWPAMFQYTMLWKTWRTTAHPSKSLRRAHQRTTRPQAVTQQHQV